MPPPSHCAANSQPVAAQAAKRCTSFFCIDLPGRSGRRSSASGWLRRESNLLRRALAFTLAGGTLPLGADIRQDNQIAKAARKNGYRPGQASSCDCTTTPQGRPAFKPDLLNRMHCGDGSGKPMLPRTHGHASQIRDAGPATPGNYVARYRGSRDCMAFPPPSATRPPPGVANGTNRGGLSAARNRPRTPRRTHAQPASPGARPPAPRPRCRSR
jgi:hypothetical protein